MDFRKEKLQIVGQQRLTIMPNIGKYGRLVNKTNLDKESERAPKFH